MERVGVRELRQNLSVYLRLVKEGESLEVTEHGHPVAVLTPLREPQRAYDRLVAEGVIRPATASFDDIPPPLGPRGTAGTDAIHVATALVLQGDVVLYSYDARTLDAAQSAGLVTASP
jgi:prevent-host-death family protein